MASAALISVDWGTTSQRLVLLDGSGAVLDRRDDGPGIQPAPTSGFAGILDRQLSPWRQAHGRLPVLMSGMIGSRQGWAEVPYLPCPAGAGDLAKALHRVQTDGSDQVYVIPGLSLLAADGTPEVMRGEETQIVGAQASLPENSRTTDVDQLFVLPGTHSKWARTTGGRITSFATYMTGEVFAAMRRHTILGRLMPDETVPFDPDGFASGVAAGAAEGHAGDLLRRLFSTRTLGLFDRLPAAALESYLSGLLIGAELSAATRDRAAPGKPLTIIASTTLADRYSHAARLLGIETARAPEDCAARGHWQIAAAANLLKSPKR